jgi:2-methylisocitrate lyase-like PEP mutase family enzyme
LTRPTLREALAQETPLVMPLAHDALCARLIERAGFRAFAIGGSAMLAARYALPDIGVAALGEMADGIRDIAAASGLPFMADGDDGYGDVKSVARTVAVYEAIGVGGILLEDQQRDVKQQRADAARGVASREAIEAKLRAALAARRSSDTLIIGRTDAYGVHGLDEAIARGRRFVDLGAEGVFVAGLKSIDDYRRVGGALRGATLLSAAVFETPGMPWPSPAELASFGFTQVSYPASLIFGATAAIAQRLAQLRAHATGETPMAPDPRAGDIRRTLDDALDVARWKAIEGDFAPAQPVAPR